MKQNKNYSGQINPEKDTEYRNCNFSQPTAIEVKEVMQGVRLFPDDDTPRTFIECNLVNCQVPPESKIERCNTALIIVKDGVKTVYGNAKGLFKEPKEYIISIRKKTTMIEIAADKQIDIEAYVLSVDGGK